jgi:hypothetical protein
MDFLDCREVAMERVIRFATLVVVLVSIGVITASAQDSLAQAAKNSQAQKKAPSKKVYTNDDFGSQVVIPAAEKAPETSSAPAEAKADDKATDKASKDEKSGEKKGAEMKQAVLDQQTKIKGIEREVNLMEREHQVRVAAYYADAGNQLRDSTKWFADEKKYNDDLAGKKKDLADAKQKLDDLQEQARKAGVPAGQLD